MPANAAKVAKKKVSGRAVLVGNLSATLLGYVRGKAGEGFTVRQLALAFPAFNAMELSHAVEELVDKGLFDQKGEVERAVYTLTDLGREGRVGVS